MQGDIDIGGAVAKGGFFNAVKGNDGRPDITYTADDMREPYRGLITDGVFSSKRVNGATSAEVDIGPSYFKVTAGSGRHVVVSAGRGVFDGHWFRTTEDRTIEVPVIDTADYRLDNVIISVNNNTRNVKIVYRMGDAGNQPSLDTSPGIVEYRIARVKIWRNAAVINDKDITDLRGYDRPEGTPWVTTVVTNQLSSEKIFTQWNDLYQKYFERLQENVTTWNAQLQNAENYMALTSYQTVRTLTGDADYMTLQAGTDYQPLPSGAYFVPLVTVNGYLLTAKKDNNPGTPGDYWMDMSNVGYIYFYFTNRLKSGSTVTFQLLRSITTSDVPTMINHVDALQDRIDDYVADQGWQEISLENQPCHYDNDEEANWEDEKVEIRKIGGMVYLRGIVCGVNPVAGNTILTLPGSTTRYSEIRPDTQHIFSSNSNRPDGKTRNRASIAVNIDGTVKFWATDKIASEAQDTASVWHLNTCWPAPFPST